MFQSEQRIQEEHKEVESTNESDGSLVCTQPIPPKYQNNFSSKVAASYFRDLKKK